MAKKNKNKGWLIFAGASALALGLYYALKGNRDTDDSPQTNQSTTAPGTQTTTSAKALDYNIALKNGSSGEEVKQLQKLLGVNVDGKFGPITEKALYSKTGLYSASLAQATKIIQEKITQAASQSRKSEVIFKYPFNRSVISSSEIVARIYENRNGYWLNSNSKGESLGSVTIKKGMDIGLINGWYDYNVPWIVILLGNNFGSNAGKKVILKGSMILV